MGSTGREISLARQTQYRIRDLDLDLDLVSMTPGTVRTYRRTVLDLDLIFLARGTVSARGDRPTDAVREQRRRCVGGGTGQEASPGSGATRARWGGHARTGNPTIRVVGGLQVLRHLRD